MPVKEAAFKVGESTVEIAAFYFRELLQLGSYFKNEQLVKCGLRYFFREDEHEFANYKEIGLSRFSSVDSYQIDRGKFENDLHFINRMAGIDILNGVVIKDIVINKSGGRHEVNYQSGDGSIRRVDCLWIVDASGRRAILQKQFGLRRKVDSDCSAVWFRVNGRLDLNNFVPDQNKSWHSRVPQKVRYYSTNHIMGNGYWIWLIPLVNNYTSVGVVFDEKFHSYTDLNSLDNCLSWIREREPVIADHISFYMILDFLSLRHYSYSSHKVFSTDRWACTGEAALFPDPFYSPGSNLIGFGNTMITSLISDYFRTGAVSEYEVDYYNVFIISQNDWLIHDIQSSYAYFGNSQVESLSIIWDVLVGWTINAPQLFNLIFLDQQKRAMIQNEIQSFSVIAFKVRKLLVDWSKLCRSSFSFEYIDYLSIPFISELYERVLQPDKSVEQIADDYKVAMSRIEEFVHVLFRLIIEDCMPEMLHRLPDPYWINIKSVSLSPDKWENGGLFKPKTTQRDIDVVDRQIRLLYTFVSAPKTVAM
jgi:flavin-dependent dehydrogenase